MSSFNKNTVVSTLKTTSKILLFFITFLYFSFVKIAVWAQTSDSSASTTTVSKDTSIKSNKAISMVFKELKKDDSILPTLGMIGVVLVIVGFAMYISFKDSGKESKA